MTPQEILEETRKAIAQSAGDDADRWFYVNRFVFARLQLDERKTKTDVKKALVDSGKPCYFCKKPFEGTVGIHLHRIDGAKGYSLENCALMHAACHRQYHAENPRGKRPGRPVQAKESKPALPVLEKSSKRYDKDSFLYWWDIAPGFVERIRDYEAIAFVKKDSQERCYVPIPALCGYLTEVRQTSRGQGNWGIRVLKDRENELAFEPGRSSDDWLFLPVVWMTEDGE